MRSALVLLSAALSVAPAAAKALPLEEAVLRAVAARTGAAPESISVTALRVAEHVPRDAAWSIDLPGDSRPCGVAVPLVARAGADRAAPRFALSAAIDFPVAALVASRAVARGEVVAAHAGTVSCASLRGAEPVGPGRWQAATGLRAGEALSFGRVRQAPDLSDGAAVTVVAAVGSVRVTAPARLVGDAWLGQPARAVNLVTHALVPGVLGPGATIVVGGAR